MKLQPTADLCDAHKTDAGSGFRALPMLFKSYGAVQAFAGVVSTVKCFEDNSVVKAAVQEPGAGRVLVVDGGASLRCALVGGNIAAAAADNGWAGLLIHGAVRDVAELRACLIGILALGSHPMASVRRDEGQRDVPVSVQGVLIWPGDRLTADEDGVVLWRPA
jgi:regulator of ribonuclease activity A